MGTRKFLTFTTHFDFVDRGFVNEVLYRNMFPIADSFRFFFSKFWVFVFGIVSYVFSFKAGKCQEKNQSGCNYQADTNCYKEGSKEEEFGQKEKGFPVPDGQQVCSTGGGKENSVVMETALVSSTSKYEFLSGKHISGFMEEPKILIFSVQELYTGSTNSTSCDNGILGPREVSVDNVLKEPEESNSFLDTGMVFDQEKTEDSVDNVLKEQEEEKPFLDTGQVFDQAKTENSVDNVLKKQEEGKPFLDIDKVFDEEKTEDSVEKVFDEEKTEDSVDKVFDEEKTEDSADKVLEKPEEETYAGNERGVFTEFKFLSNYDLSNEVPRLSEHCLISVDSKLDTIGSCDGFSTSNGKIVFDSYEILSERNFGEELGTESIETVSEEKVESIESILDQETFVTFDSDDEYIELQLESPSSSVIDGEIWSTEDIIQAEEEDLSHEETEPADTPRLYEEPQLENSNLHGSEDNHEEDDLFHSSVKFEEYSMEENESISDSDDEDDDDDLEFALEHEDIIEQLKLELKMARTGGLPTILEESESPLKTLQELKPLKIDQKFDHFDRMIEIHKLYKSYLDKMRKLDILNSQTMHAISLLQLKRPAGQLIKTQKSAVPGIKSLLSQNLWSCKPQRREANPTLKFIGDLQKDYELVYVGQLCLSWEILHWQYKKALELQEFDAQELRQYNQVAGDFQLFQVLLERFIESEPFQRCPRVQNYVNNRRVHCNFLLVPVIKDDSLKDKKGIKRDGEDAITSPMLTEIIEESMRVFLEFIRADKAETDIILKGPELQDSIDSELLTDIRTEYQNKEKRLKEILRSGSCIVKKLQRQHENRSNHALLFAQVELKLISRVLTMSKLTADQLVWCHEKLDKITFCNRKLVLEPSFLLFPC